MILECLAVFLLLQFCLCYSFFVVVVVVCFIIGAVAGTTAGFRPSVMLCDPKMGFSTQLYTFVDSLYRFIFAFNKAIFFRSVSSTFGNFPRKCMSEKFIYLNSS